MQRFANLVWYKRMAVIFSVLFAIIFTYKYFGLADYNFYEAKVVGFDTVARSEPTYSSRGRKNHYYSVMRTTAIIEYYTPTDTIVYDEGKRTILSYLTLNDARFYITGERLKVMELKAKPGKVKPYTFFHYWLYMYELVAASLIVFIVYGFVNIFIKKS